MLGGLLRVMKPNANKSLFAGPSGVFGSGVSGACDGAALGALGIQREGCGQEGLICIKPPPPHTPKAKKDARWASGSSIVGLGGGASWPLVVTLFSTHMLIITEYYCRAFDSGL